MVGGIFPCAKKRAGGFYVEKRIGLVTAIDLEEYEYSKKVIVDAQKELDRYKGVYSMTPNLPDTQKHVGFYLNSKEKHVDEHINFDEYVFKHLKID